MGGVRTLQYSQVMLNAQAAKATRIGTHAQASSDVPVTVAGMKDAHENEVTGASVAEVDVAWPCAIIN